MTAGPRNLSVITYLTDGEACALSQLVKRIGWTDFERLAVDRDEAELMKSAVLQLQYSLADQGFAPR